MAVTILAIVGVALAAAYMRDRFDRRNAQRAALHAALERGEIGPEDYARALQSA